MLYHIPQIPYIKYIAFLACVLLLSSCNDRNPTAGDKQIADVHPEQRQITSGRLITDTAELQELYQHAQKMFADKNDSALLLYDDILTGALAVQDVRLIPKVLISKGAFLYNYKQAHAKSKALFDAALPYCLDTVNASLLPRLYDCMGNVHFASAQYDSAVAYYFLSIHLLEKTTPVDSIQLSNVYKNVAAAFGYTESYNKAIHYSKKALNLQPSSMDKEKTATILANIGSAYGRTEAWDSAASYYQGAINLLRQSTYKPYMQEIYNSMAALWLHRKNTSLAELYLDSAIAADKESVSTNYRLMQNIGCVYYFKGAFQQAIPYYEQSKLLAAQRGDRQNMLNCYNTLAAIYDTIGQGSLAYQHHKQYASLKDSLLNEKNVHTVQQLETKYQSNKKDKEIAEKRLQLTQKNLKIRNQYLWIAVSALCILALTATILLKLNRNKLSRVKSQLAGEEKERSRIAKELHDGIVNKLSSIKMNLEAVQYHSKDEAYTDHPGPYTGIIHELEESIGELRATSHNLLPEHLYQTDLDTALRRYCQFINSHHTLSIRYECIGLLPYLSNEVKLNIYRMVQELISNIVKHAQATHAGLQLHISHKTINITLEDNGRVPLLKEDGSTYGQGIGLTTLQSRLQLLNGRMHVSSRDGNSIYIELSLKKSMTKKEI